MRRSFTTCVQDIMRKNHKRDKCRWREKAYAHNTNGTFKQEVNGRKQNTLYKYDAAGRVIKRTDNAGTKNEYTVEYTYDNAGNILTADDGKGVIIRTYDCMNRVTSYTDYKGNTVKFEGFVIINGKNG